MERAGGGSLLPFPPRNYGLISPSETAAGQNFVFLRVNKEAVCGGRHRHGDYPSASRPGGMSQARGYQGGGRVSRNPHEHLWWFSRLLILCGRDSPIRPSDWSPGFDFLPTPGCNVLINQTFREAETSEFEMVERVYCLPPPVRDLNPPVGVFSLPTSYSRYLCK